MRVKRLFQLSKDVALAAAVVLVVLLALQQRSLSERYATLRERTLSLHTGLYVPTFQTRTLQGDSVTIGATEPAAKQVLFFFTTTCPYCRASLPAWNRVASRIREKGDATVYGVALDSLHLVHQYVREHDLRFPVVLLPERKLARIYRITGVPLTAVLDNEGRVVYSRAGEFAVQQAIDSLLASVQEHDIRGAQ